MALSNTATPKYYGRFRDAVMRGEIPVNQEISMQMNRIDDLIANPGVWYDDQAVEGYIRYCENELTLTDGSNLALLDSFKLWAEDALGWYYFVERSVWEPYEEGGGGRYVNKLIKKRLINKQYLIVARGAAKSMYASTIQSYRLNCDKATTYQISVAVTKSGTAKAPSFKFAFSNLKGANGTSSILTFSNVSVPATAWASNTTQSAAGFGFRATIALSGVTSAMVPDVYLNVADAMSGDFSPVAQSYNGGIYIYASFKPTAALTIPTIRLTKS